MLATFLQKHAAKSPTLLRAVSWALCTLSRNHDETEFYDPWFPSLLAYYGEYYIKNNKEGKWESLFNKKQNVWIPQITLDDNTSAFNMHAFYTNLYESPITLIEDAGDFDRKRRR